MTALVLALTGTALAFALASWLPESGSRLQIALTAVMVATFTSVGVLLLMGDGVATWREVARDGELLIAGVLAILGGGPLTTSIMALADRGNPRKQSTQVAGEVLRGGALIGALERAAIFGAVVSGWPEGLAVILALKGLARYPELRSPDQPQSVTPQAVAERFIIGTFTSVLWAVACAGLLLS